MVEVDCADRDRCGACRFDQVIDRALARPARCTQKSTADHTSRIENFDEHQLRKNVVALHLRGVMSEVSFSAGP